MPIKKRNLTATNVKDNGEKNISFEKQLKAEKVFFCSNQMGKYAFFYSHLTKLGHFKVLKIRAHVSLQIQI